MLKEIKSSYNEITSIIDAEDYITDLIIGTATICYIFGLTAILQTIFGNVYIYYRTLTLQTIYEGIKYVVLLITFTSAILLIFILDTVFGRFVRIYILKIKNKKEE